MAATRDPWVIWPDDFMAPAAELDYWIRNGRSDDVLRVIVIEYGGDGLPLRWIVKSALWDAPPPAGTDGYDWKPARDIAC